ncbi:hypothetical protein CANCADRAFT_31484, partial [Tortispora caseinolytica NRRL Y-17796]
MFRDILDAAPVADQSAHRTVILCGGSGEIQDIVLNLILQAFQLPKTKKPLNHGHVGSTLKYIAIPQYDNHPRSNVTCHVYCAPGPAFPYKQVLSSLIEKSPRVSVLLLCDWSNAPSWAADLSDWLYILSTCVDTNTSLDVVRRFNQSYGISASTSALVSDTELAPSLIDETSLCLGVFTGLVLVDNGKLDVIKNSMGWRESHLSYFEQFIRLTALKLSGFAAFVSSYTTTKNSLLPAYISTLLSSEQPIDLSEQFPASVSDFQSLFIPIGWDSQLKIQIISAKFPYEEYTAALAESVTNGSSRALCDLYDPFIKPIWNVSETNGAKPELDTELPSEQEFLAHLQQMFESSPNDSKRTAHHDTRTIGTPTPKPGGRTSLTPTTSNTPSASSPSVTPKGLQDRETVSSFFQSFVAKKSDSSSPSSRNSPAS